MGDSRTSSSVWTAPNQHLHGTGLAAILYTLIDSAKLAGVGPHTYLKTAINAALQGVEIPLPHEIA